MRASRDEAKAQRSTSELLRDLSDEIRRLIRDELILARHEVRQRLRKAGGGMGALGSAGAIALVGALLLLAAAVLGLAVVLPAWLAALIIGVALLAVGGVGTLVGKSKVQEAMPPVTAERQASVQQDIEEVRKGMRR